MERFILVISLMAMGAFGHPMPEHKGLSGLDLVLSNLDQSVIVSGEAETFLDEEVTEDEPQQVTAIPVLPLLAFDPSVSGLLVQKESEIYSNDTDQYEIVKLKVISSTVATAHDGITTVAAEGDTDSTDTTEVAATEKTAKLQPATTTSDPVAKEAEEDIKDKIKEVEAMPVILTVGV